MRLPYIDIDMSIEQNCRIGSGASKDADLRTPSNQSQEQGRSMRRGGRVEW